MPTASRHRALVWSISIVVPPNRCIIGPNFRWAFLAARRQQRRSAGAGSVSMSISRSLEFELGVQAFEIPVDQRSEEHTSELQSLMRSSYAVFCLKKKKHEIINSQIT